MKKVVYFIGAGFSAPLGIPVMNNFYLMGRDIYFKNPGRFKHFLDVITSIEKLSKVKNFFDSDLYNIEEILSLLDMGIEMGSDILEITNKEAFLDFISDIVEYFTPKLEPLDKSKLPDSFPLLQKDIIGKKEKDKLYGSFVAGLFPIKFKISEKRQQINPEKLTFSISENPEAKYSIITLNCFAFLEIGQPALTKVEKICIILNKE